MPTFILAAPLVTTNGGTNYRQADTYNYSEATWSEIKKDRLNSTWMESPPWPQTFKTTSAVRSAIFLTGWEAGGHTVWAMILQTPNEWPPRLLP